MRKQKKLYNLKKKRHLIKKNTFQLLKKLEIYTFRFASFLKVEIYISLKMSVALFC